jgi:hypothetical protein
MILPDQISNQMHAQRIVNSVLGYLSGSRVLYDGNCMLDKEKYEDYVCCYWLLVQLHPKSYSCGHKQGTVRAYWNSDRKRALENDGCRQTTIYDCVTNTSMDAALDMFEGIE